jgi:cyanophycin synthetase
MHHVRGPNLWTWVPINEVWVDLGVLEDHPSDTIPGYYERLVEWLPGLIEHRCSIGERGGFLQRLQRGTWAGHVMEHVSLELQTLAGIDDKFFGFGRARETSERGVYKVVISTPDEVIGRTTLTAARDLVMAAMNGEAFDVKAVVDELIDLVDDRCLGPSTACIVDAAKDRHIPHIRLTSGNLVQLGYGSRQRRIWTAESDRTSAIAEGISSDKDLTKALLSNCGIPIPEGKVVDSPEAAWEAAQDIGLPVVVKPLDANHGRGVSLNLNHQTEVEAAFQVAKTKGTQVIVERYIQGEEHRLLVVGDRVVAASKGELATIVGDGQSSVAQLIETQINSDPRRGIEQDFPLDKIRLDRQPHAVLELQRQGLSADSVVEQGRVVIVQRNGNLNHDVTPWVHPEVAAMATLAARVVGLDIAGIDMVTQDITKPLQSQNGAIVEVNAGPGLLMHLKPATGEPRPVGKAIADHLFGANHDGRIPVVGITGSAQTSLLSQLVGWLLHLSGKRTGVACRDGLFMDQRLVDPSDSRAFDQGERLLINRSLDAAVIETAARNVVEDGYPYDLCQVGVITDLPTDDLSDHDMTTPEQMRTVIRTQMDVVLSQGVGVLNADDETIAGLAELCNGEVVFYSLTPENPVVNAHIKMGKRAVFLRDQHVVLARGDQENPLFHLDLAPIAHMLQKGMHRSTLLAAVATAWSLDIAPLLIRAGLKNFSQQTRAEQALTSPTKVA